MTKRLLRRARSTTVALGEMALDAVFLLPLAAWQVVGAGYHFTRNDWIASLALGVLCTAIPYVLYAEGLQRIRVEHAFPILGYLEPVSAPFYALLLLGEAPEAATILGGALIVVAGVLVVVFGRPEVATESRGQEERDREGPLPPRLRPRPAQLIVTAGVLILLWGGREAPVLELPT